MDSKKALQQLNKSFPRNQGLEPPRVQAKLVFKAMTPEEKAEEAARQEKEQETFQATQQHFSSMLMARQQELEDNAKASKLQCNIL